MSSASCCLSDRGTLRRDGVTHVDDVTKVVDVTDELFGDRQGDRE